MATGAVIARIVSQYTDKGSKAARKDISKLGKDFDAFGKKAAKAFGVAAVAAAGLAAKLAKDGVKGAMEDQKAQALLANTIRNTTNATDAAIKANLAYIDSTELRLGVDDQELIPSLQRLIGLTGDLSKAQSLQGLALDISADKNIDLGAATKALTKAYSGEFKALKTLYPELDKTALAAGNVGAIFDQVAKSAGGAAEARANTLEYKFRRLNLAFENILKTVGAALLPAIEKIAEAIQNLLPEIEKWIEANGTKLVGAINVAISYGYAFFKLLVDLTTFVANNIGVFTTLGAVIFSLFVGAKIAAGVTAFIGALKLIIKFFKILRAEGIKAAFATSLATGGASAVAGAAAFTVALGASALVINKFNKDADKASQGIDKLSVNLDGMKGSADDYTKGLEGITKGLTTVTNKTKQLTAAEKAKLKLDQFNAKLQKKFGVSLTSKEDQEKISQAAIVYNAQRSKNIETLELLRKQELAKYTQVLILLGEERNLTAQRANDIAEEFNNVLDITKEGLDRLATKWGLTYDEARKYVDIHFIIQDNQITTAEIEAYRKEWGGTAEEARKFLSAILLASKVDLGYDDIVKYANEFKILPLEAAKYIAAAVKYRDNKFDDKDITAIKDAFVLTNDEAAKLIGQLNPKFVTTGTILDTAPVNALTESLKAAAAAAAALASILKGIGGFTAAPITSGGVTRSPSEIAAITKLHPSKIASEESGTIGARSIENQIGKAVFDEAEAANKLAYLAIAQSNETLMAKVHGESGALGARMLELAAAKAAKDFSLQNTSVDLEDVQEKMRIANYQSMLNPQAIELATDESARIRAMRNSTLALAQGGLSGNNSSSPIEINITVEGSVTSEQDLLQTIRNGLLAEQYNGNSISLQAV